MTLSAADLAARLAEGVVLHEQNRLNEAEALYLDVINIDPRNTEALKLLAILNVARSNLDDALSYALAAVELAPDVGDYQHLTGRIYIDMQNADSAMPYLKAALVASPSDSLNLNLDIAECYALNSEWAESFAVAERQAQAYPQDLRALETAALAAENLDQPSVALQYYERLTAIDNSNPAVFANAAKIYRASGDLGKAWIYAERALALAPSEPDLHFLTRVIRAEAVPAWHFNMMNDATRNTVFKRAIERQIKPHHVVLEIGTGAGLLAMMAGKTGARVYSCEVNPALAMTARGTITQNGLADKVTIIDKPSWEVEVGVDLPQRADVLIAEIFSAQFLSEDVIPTLEDAKARLLKPGGVIIPAGGALIGALVQSDELAQLTRVGRIEGFNFDSFNAFTPVAFTMDTPNMALTWLSDPMVLFDFDFQNADVYPATQSNAVITVKQDGLCQGLVQWLNLTLDDETNYSNPPDGADAVRTKHWTPLFYPFPVPVRVKSGQTVVLRTGHDRKGVRLELDRVV
jgi:type III protein arginine methyltransferase